MADVSFKDVRNGCRLQKQNREIKNRLIRSIKKKLIIQ